MHHNLEHLKRDIIICWTQQVNLLTCPDLPALSALPSPAPSAHQMCGRLTDQSRHRES